MQLLADRFAIDDDGVALDLSTGRHVALRRVEEIGAADRAAQLRWSMRCDRWLRLHHRAVASLLDYGLAGRADRFEAWECGAVWNGSPAEAERIRGIATRFMAASGMTAAAMAVHDRNGGAVVLIGSGDGYDAAVTDGGARGLPRGARGLTRIPRSAVAALAEMFESVSERRPSVASLWGRPGSGRRTVVLELARVARLQGFVPVISGLLTSKYAPLWQGRSLFMIHDERDGPPSGAWHPFLDATIRIPLPHVLLLVGEDESPFVNGIALEPVGVDQLVAAVVPAPLPPRLETQARRTALESRGRPGRFARLLWPDWIRNRIGSRQRTGLRAAERAPTYGVDQAVACSAAVVIDGAAGPGDTWPAAGELAALRKRVALANAQLAGGRHAPAIRQLRHASSALARRDAWSDAADSAVTIGRALLARGRAADAIAALEDARAYAGRTGDDRTLLDVAVLSAEARIDLVRFDEAEAVLAAAVTTAVHARDTAGRGAATTALARCLFWRGQYVDAASALEQPFEGAPTVARVRRQRLHARIGVARGDFAGAMAGVTLLKQDADVMADAALRAAVTCTSSFVHLAVGDLDAAIQDARDSMSAARAARDPLRSVRARLLAVEAERRRGHLPAVSAHIDRLRRLRPSLPPLLRARFDVVAALTADGNVDAAAVARHVADAGVPALALYAPADPRRGGIDSVVDDLLVILRTCQTADDEAVVLKDVCAHVRRQLRAIGAAFVARTTIGACDSLAADGSRVELEIAERAMTAAIVIPPHRYGDRIEGAAPVLYGGRPIGALSVRWSIGSSYDADRATNVLAMAATAAAPMVAAAAAHRVHAALPEGAAVAPLLGMTPLMTELRRAAQRAGAAPFGVLIVGESGSGKELVARAIHRSSPRRDGPFCTLNCAALPDDLVESELFGHARGAFTGAVADRIGVFEEAHGGTLFLDEIGELAPRAQAKILRVVQENELRRVGDNVPRRVDVRLIAATNRDLASEVDAGRFRLDLLYRLDVVRITVPPLRDRVDDVAVLAARFWRDATARIDSRATLAPATLAALARYRWPGNVRELQNVLASLAVRCPRRGLVPPSALPTQFRGALASADDACRLDDARRTFEERFVRAALVRTGGHRTRAAAELGVSRQGLTKLLARLGIADAP